MRGHVHSGSCLLTRELPLKPSDGAPHGNAVRPAMRDEVDLSVQHLLQVLVYSLVGGRGIVFYKALERCG